jgi:hypothetical protein
MIDWGKNEREQQRSIHADLVAELGLRDPDHRPSSRPMRVIDGGKTLKFQLDVVGRTCIEMIVEGDPKTGKLTYRGMRLCPGTK